MKSYLRRESVLFSFFLLLTFLLTSIPLQAQSVHIIIVQPSSGTPGTTVIISDASGTNRSKTCFVSIGGTATSIGQMLGAITYVVPANFAPQTITFVCTGGPDRQRTNTASFVVTGAAIVIPPNDSDGDGLPDSRDNCPTAAGPVDNSGCPMNVQTDGDGDGVPDTTDACPTAAGIVANNGCPIPPSPTAPAILLPSLPASGACVLATLDADFVNIRELASTQAAIVARLNPTTVASVLAVTTTAEGEWFQIDGGWVAGWVTRRGGDCSGVRQAGGSPDEVAEPPAQAALPGFVGGVTVASGDINGDALQDCPNYIPMLNALPIFVSLYIVGESDPCSVMQTELDGLFLAGAQLPSFSADDFESCHGLLDFDFYLYFFHEFMDRLHSFAPATWQVVDDFLPTDTPCTFIYDLMGDGRLPAEVPDEHVAPFAVAYCMFGDMSQNWFDKTVGFMNVIGFRRDSVEQLESEDESADDGCRMVSFVRPVGFVYPANVELYQFLHTVCLVNAAHAAHEAIYQPIREALDAQSQLDNCGGTDDMVYHPLPADLQPALPAVAQGDTCIGNFRLLATFNQTLGLEMLYRMLVSPNACELAWEYARDGYLGQISGLPAPACVQGDQLVLTGTLNQMVVLNKQSPWREKLRVLDRPFDQVCDWITLPGESDSFAPNPTSILGSDDIAIAPSATPFGFVIAPSTTPLGIVLVTTPVPPDNGEPAPDQPSDDQPAPDEPPPDQPPADDQLPSVPSAPFEPTETPFSGESSSGEGIGGDETITIGGGQTESGGAGANELVLDDTAGAEAVFLATDADGRFNGVYLVQGVQHRYSRVLDPQFASLLESYPVSLTPDGQYLTYFTTGANPATEQTRQISVIVEPDTTHHDTHELEEVSLVYHKIDWMPAADGSLALAPASDESVTLSFPVGLSPAPYTPAYVPESDDQVMVLFEAGVPSLYRLDFSTGDDVVVAERLVENAAAPSVSPDGRYIAFERQDASGRNIYVMATNSGEVLPITRQQGSECYAPQFGSDSLSLFFTCQSGTDYKLFRYGIAGITELAVGVPNAANPVPSSIAGFITFDDGYTIYISREDGTQVEPLVMLDGAGASHIVWAKSAQPFTPDPVTEN